MVPLFRPAAYLVKTAFSQYAIFLKCSEMLLGIDAELLLKDDMLGSFRGQGKQIGFLMFYT